MAAAEPGYRYTHIHPPVFTNCYNSRYKTPGVHAGIFFFTLKDSFVLLSGCRPINMVMTKQTTARVARTATAQI